MLNSFCLWVYECVYECVCVVVIDQARTSPVVFVLNERVSSQAHYQAELPEPVGPAGEIFHNYGLLCFFYYMTLTGLERALYLFYCQL